MCCQKWYKLYQVAVIVLTILSFFLEYKLTRWEKDASSGRSATFSSQICAIALRRDLLFRARSSISDSVPWAAAAADTAKNNARLSTNVKFRNFWQQTPIAMICQIIHCHQLLLTSRTVLAPRFLSRLWLSKLASHVLLYGYLVEMAKVHIWHLKPPCFGINIKIASRKLQWV